MSNNNSFVFNLDWYAVMLEYPPEVRFEVYEAIFIYAASGTLPELKPLAKMAFSFIKKEMDYNRERYESVVEKRKLAGKRSAESRLQNQQMTTSVEDVQQNQQVSTNSTHVESVQQNQHMSTKPTYNDNDNVNDNDIKKQSKKSVSVENSESQGSEKKPSKLETEFEKFRQEYPGTKRGPGVELENFKKKYPGRWKDIIPLLMPAVQRLIAHHNAAEEGRRRDPNVFVPNYPHLSTWLNNARWEDEFPEIHAAGIPLKPAPPAVTQPPENEPSDFGGCDY